MLRQPEVSIAMTELEDLGIVVHEAIKKGERKGRPVYHYRLKVPKQEALRLLAADQLREMKLGSGT